MKFVFLHFRSRTQWKCGMSPAKELMNMCTKSAKGYSQTAMSSSDPWLAFGATRIHFLEVPSSLYCACLPSSNIYFTVEGSKWMGADMVADATDHFNAFSSSEITDNELVEVCAGPLFTYNDEFHVQTLQSFVMPDETSKDR